MNETMYWEGMDQLVADLKLIIDRPRGSVHPRYTDFIYPYDYGYLQGTQSMDQGGIDVWVGSQKERGVTAIICAVDLVKKDAEMKILLGCTSEEAQAILKIHNDEAQSAILIKRPGAFE